MLRGFLIFACLLALGLPARAAERDPDTGTITIMRPEPPTAPKMAPAQKHPAKKNKKKSGQARGSSNPVYPIPLPKPQRPAALPKLPAPPQRPQTPPPLYVPQTGRLLPNLPSTGSGPGRETFQDRAARCANQAGIYGPNATGDRGSYIRGCINQ
jgi:hypothetical protein